MRVLQLIDSLQTGGAERVAVNIANGLVPYVEASFLCATRQEGLLKNSLDTSVGYLLLNKTKTLDFKAIKKLNQFIKANKITVIHAHSTSFFLATIIKLQNKKIKLVWHDHYGKSEFLDQRNHKILKKCASYFSHIFSVNTTLEVWAKQKLKAKSVSYLPNFAVPDTTKPQTNLKGKAEKRILHLANLRPQKDHFTLLEAFKKITKKHPDWSLHCVGKNFEDDYAKAVQLKVEELKLANQVFFYGSQPDITYIIKQCNIAVLSSKSEGLPIALLEYGLNKMPVVATNVGNCKEVIPTKKEGFLIEAESIEALSNAINFYIENREDAIEAGKHIFERVHLNFSAKAVVLKIVEIYKML
ncbi:glycosyltransferase family 4 protein [Lacinutrix salivirga]